MLQTKYLDLEITRSSHTLGSYEAQKSGYERKMSWADAMGLRHFKEDWEGGRGQLIKLCI